MEQQRSQGWRKSLINKSKDASETVQFRRDLRTLFDHFIVSSTTPCFQSNHNKLQAQAQLRLQTGQAQLQTTVSHVATHVANNNRKIQILLSAAEQGNIIRCVICLSLIYAFSETRSLETCWCCAVEL
jgi:hypothetical protein